MTALSNPVLTSIRFSSGIRRFSSRQRERRTPCPRSRVSGSCRGVVCLGGCSPTPPTSHRRSGLRFRFDRPEGCSSEKGIAVHQPAPRAPLARPRANRRASQRSPHRRWVGWGAFFVGLPTALFTVGPRRHSALLSRLAGMKPANAHQVAARVTETPVQRSKRRMERLGHTLRDLAHHAPALKSAVYVEDIETGRSAGANANEPF